MQFSADLCQRTQSALVSVLKNDTILGCGKDKKYVQLTGTAGSQRVIDMLYTKEHLEEVAAWRKHACPKTTIDMCPWGHESPPSKYCPRRNGAITGGWDAGRRCAVCVSSRWERIIYALVQMTGLIAKKHYIDGRELDIYIPELAKAIEYNGEQHYKAGLFTKDLTHRLWKDQEKAFSCHRAKIKLLYVRFDDPNPITTVLEFLQG